MTINNLSWFIETLSKNNYNFIEAFDTNSNFWYIVVKATTGSILIQFKDNGEFVSFGPNDMTVEEHANSIFAAAIADNTINFITYHNGDKVWNSNAIKHDPTSENEKEIAKLLGLKYNPSNVEIEDKENKEK